MAEDEPKPPTRRNGRPPIDPESPSVKVTLRISERDYDALWTVAHREGTSVPAIIRRRARLGPSKDDPKT